MAEDYNTAFGQYLKVLRDRRGLSLDDVRSLSQTFPDPVTKGYLSRVENGHQKLAFPKVISLSRIYDVPSDVLLERLELDMELDRVGGPDTEGLRYMDLYQRSKVAIDRGFRWEAYGLSREATTIAHLELNNPANRDVEEQVAHAFMNCGTAARALGRYRYALHEFLYVETLEALGPKYHALLLDRLGATCSTLGQFDRSIRYAEAAIAEAEAHGDLEYVGCFYQSRAVVAMARGDASTAEKYERVAYDHFKKNGDERGCARALNNLAQSYFSLGRFGAARKAAEAAVRLSRSIKQLRIAALSTIMLGNLSSMDGNSQAAVSRWKEAAAIAKDLNDKVLRFKAEIAMFRHMLATHNVPVARAIQRRMRKLSPWVPGDTHELDEFYDLVLQNQDLFDKTVASPQHLNDKFSNP